MYDRSFAERFVSDNLLSQKNARRPFLVGSDWWDDCDDVLAMKLFTFAANAGIIDLRGVALNALKENSVASLCAFLENGGLSPRIGADFSGIDYGGYGLYQARMAPFAEKYKKNEDAEDGVRLYRSVLAAAEDHTVELCEIGFPTLLCGLLKSGADDLSPFGGVELVRQKVKKLWYMAGDWRSDGAKENNFSRVPQIYAASETVLKLFPCEITFLGLEIGLPVISGACLAGKDTFTAHALADAHHADGRNSWDPMTALLALCGDEEKAGYSVTRGKARVDGATGKNYFSRSEDGKHAYVTALHEPSFYSSVIDFLLAPCGERSP